MRFFKTYLAILVAESVLCGLLVVSGVSYRFLNQVVAVALLLILLILATAFSKRKYGVLSQNIKYSLLALLSFFIHLIVLATGGFSSQLLIFIHLFTLALSFLINTRFALIFLLFSLVILTMSIFVDPLAHRIFFDDVNSSFLRLMTFVITVPLVIQLEKYYHLKDLLLSFMRGQLALKDSQQQSVLKNIQEWVFVTDPELKIISASDSVGELLSLSKPEILYHKLTDLLFLRDKDNRVLNPEHFKLGELVKLRGSISFDNLLLFKKNSAFPLKVNLRVTPIISLTNEVEELTCILVESGFQSQIKTAVKSVESVSIKYSARFEELRTKLKARGMVDLLPLTEITKRIEQDLTTFLLIQSNPIKLELSVADISRIVIQIVKNEADLAKALGVKLDFERANLPEEKTKRFIPASITVDQSWISSAFFSAKVDIKWFEVLIRKLTDLCLMLASGVTGPSVKVRVENIGEGLIKLSFSVTINPKASPNLDSIFELQNDYFSEKALYASSGLEGYIVKNIIQAHNIPFNISFDRDKGVLGIYLKMPHHYLFAPKTAP